MLYSILKQLHGDYQYNMTEVLIWNNTLPSIRCKPPLPTKKNKQLATRFVESNFSLRPSLVGSTRCSWQHECRRQEFLWKNRTRYRQKQFRFASIFGRHFGWWWPSKDRHYHPFITQTKTQKRIKDVFRFVFSKQSARKTCLSPTRSNGRMNHAVIWQHLTLGAQIVLPPKHQTLREVLVDKFLPTVVSLWANFVSKCTILTSKSINQAIIDALHFSTPKRVSSGKQTGWENVVRKWEISRNKLVARGESASF